MVAINILFVLCAFYAFLALAAVKQDEITHLPGWNQALPSRQYSGYLQVGESFLHYWLVLSESNPSTDPVVLWLNGGNSSCCCHIYL